MHQVVYKMSDDNFVETKDVPDDEIEKVVHLIVKTFCDNKVTKPISGVAMIVLITRLEAEGYRFSVVPIEPPSTELH